MGLFTRLVEIEDDVNSDSVIYYNKWKKVKK